MRWTSLAAVLTAAAALAPAAPAAAAEGVVGQGTLVRLTGPADIDTLVYDLPAGDYAVFLSGTIGGEAYTALLRAPDGRVLCRRTLGPLASGGCEFRATARGRYRLVLRDAVTTGPGARPYPREYQVRVVLDCDDTTATRCAIDPGERRTSGAAFGGDRDLFRTRLQAGRSYSLALESTATDVGTTAFLDRAGRRLDADGQAFRPPATGTYYVEVRARPNLGGDRYTVTLASP